MFDSEEVSQPTAAVTQNLFEIAFSACVHQICELLKAPLPAESVQQWVAEFCKHRDNEEVRRLLTSSGIETNYVNLTTLGAFDELPVLVCSDSTAWVVLERREDAGFLVFDGSAGAEAVPMQMTLDEITQALASWVGLVAYALKRKVTANKALSAWLRADWFWQPIFENRWAYIQVLMASVLINIFSLVVSIFSMVVYDRIVPNKAFDSLIALTFGVGVALSLDFVIKHIRTAFIEESGRRIDLNIGRTLLNRITNMRMDARPSSVGSMASTFREAETLRDFFTSATLATLIDLPFLFFFILVIWLLGGRLALVPLLAVPFALGTTVLLEPFMKAQMADSLKVAQSKHGVIVEILSGLETIKSIGVVGLMGSRWERAVVSQSAHERKARLMGGWALGTASLVQQAAQVGIVFYGVYLIDEQAITMGTMIAAVMLTGRALAPLAQLANLLVRLNQARAAFVAADKLMALPSDRPFDRSYTHSAKINGALEFVNVTFRYPGQDKPALDGVSFKVKPGEHIALLGRIGSGKSTLAKLLLGLYEPQSGSIFVDGVDLRQIDPLVLRKQMGTLPQDIWLFSGTVRENIAVGAESPSSESVIVAAVVSGAHDFLRQHPQGYEMELGERGQGLSGGQRQAIALARSIVGNPQVMLLDEPTSMMDGGTEQGVVKRLKEKFAGSTLIVTTHRTSLLALADRVIVLDAGRIVSDSTTAEFIAASNLAAQAAALR